MGNLHEVEDYFRLFFIMAEVDNLDTYLGVTLVYFHNGKGG